MRKIEANLDKGKRHSGMFKPGVSGNPAGRPKSNSNIREIAKLHTAEAIQTLLDIMQDPKASHTARVHAADSILNRAWGKPTQYVESLNVGMNYQDFLDGLIESEKETQKTL